MRNAPWVDGRLEVRRAGASEFPRADWLTPDPSTVWPQVVPIQEVWLRPNERTLVVVAFRGFDMALHSLEVEESAAHVSLLAKVAFTLEGARRLALPSEQPGIPLIGLPWRAEVRLEAPLGDRPVVDRDAGQRSAPRPDPAQSSSDQVLARLRSELATASTPSERRRIRHEIKVVRRNPYKALWASEMGGARP